MSAGRVVVGLATAAVALTTGVGALHLPAARPALRWLMGGCPIGADLPPEQRDLARAAAVDAVRGVGAAPTNEALGFALGVTSRDDVAAWASTEGVTCVPARTTLRCDAVPGALAGLDGRGELRFDFDAKQRLVGLTGSWEVPAARGAGWVDQQGATLGEATLSHGDAAPAWLVAGPLRQVSREYRFADYRAILTATHTGGGRVVARGAWQTIAPG